MGSLLRSAYGFGADLVFVANGCDVYSPKVVRSSMGVCLNSQMPIWSLSWNEISVVLKEFEDKINPSPLSIFLAVCPQTSSQNYYNANFCGHTVLVIGSESHGIGREGLSIGGAQFVNIPMGERKMESLNASVAGSILLSEICRQRKLITP